jgi:hypothetical protein
MMWPILNSLGASIAKAKKDGQIVGLMVESTKSFEGFNLDEMLSSGFVAKMDGCMVLDRQTFLLSELKKWVPGFNAAKMINNEMPAPIVDITDDASLLVSRKFAISPSASFVSQFDLSGNIKSHPQYNAAKGGDVIAADKLVSDLVTPEYIFAIKEKFGVDAAFMPIASVEISGCNQIPNAMAAIYAEQTGGFLAGGLFQTNKAFHTGSDAMGRLIARSTFDGNIIPGQKYVLVDDVSTMGGTLADAASYIQGKGGIVLGASLLVNASRSGKMSPDGKTIEELKERHGSAIKEIFSIDPGALTNDEAQYLIGFRTTDELRARAIAAVAERSERILSKNKTLDENVVGIASGVGSDTPEQGQAASSLAPQDEISISISVPQDQKGKPKKKIVDAGEKIGRARKDMYSRQLGVADLAGMPQDDRDRLISKSIWTYSFRDAYDRGVSCAVADWIKTLRLNFPEMGTLSKENVTHEVFMGVIDCFRKYFDPVITSDDFVAALAAIQKDPSWMTYEKASRASYIESSWSKKYNNFRYMMNANLDLPTGSDKPKTWGVHKYQESLESNGPDYVESNAERIAWWWSRKLGVKTQDQLDQKRSDRKKGPSTPDRPHLDRLENAWLTKSGEDISAEQLMSRFGFRAIEFGEWLPQDERQRVLNEGYSACAALSEILGIPEKMVSFNGALAAAFGSRGKGRAAAHYEPGLKVFNLTRMNGAGSMAHEWGHALDNIIGERVSNVSGKFLTDTPGSGFSRELDALIRVMTSTKDEAKWLPVQMAEISRGIEWGSSWLRLSKEDASEARFIMRDAVFKLAGIAIDDKDLPGTGESGCALFDVSNAEFAQTGGDADLFDLLRERLKTRFGVRITLRSNPFSIMSKKDPSKQFHLNTGSALTAAKTVASYLKTKDMAVVDFCDTNFIAESKKLDEKKSTPYYSTKLEMFARAFECYVYDKLHEAGVPCDYLVHSVQGSRYAGNTFTGEPVPSR